MYWAFLSMIIAMGIKNPTQNSTMVFIHKEKLQGKETQVVFCRGKPLGTQVPTHTLPISYLYPSYPRVQHSTGTSNGYTGINPSWVYPGFIGKHRYTNCKRCRLLIINGIPSNRKSSFLFTINGIHDSNLPHINILDQANFAPGLEAE